MKTEEMLKLALAAMHRDIAKRKLRPLHRTTDPHELRSITVTTPVPRAPEQGK